MTNSPHPPQGSPFGGPTPPPSSPFGGPTTPGSSYREPAGGSPFDSPFGQQPGWQQPGGADPFGGGVGDGPAPAPSTTASAPVVRLVPSAVAGVISLVLSLYLFISSAQAGTGSYLGFSLVSWLLAGALGVGALGWYFTGDAQARASSVYIEEPGKHAMYFATLALLGLAIILSSVHLGLHFGKAF